MPTESMFSQTPSYLGSSTLQPLHRLPGAIEKIKTTDIFRIDLLDPAFGISGGDKDKEILASYADAEPVTKAQMELCIGKLRVFIQQFNEQSEVDSLTEDEYKEVEAIIGSTPGSASQYHHIKKLAILKRNTEAMQCASVVLTYIAQNTSFDTGCPEGSWSTAAYWDEYPELAESQPCVKEGACPEGFEISEIDGETVCAYKSEEVSAGPVIAVPSTGVMGWWQSQSTTMKMVYGGGAALAIFLLYRGMRKVKRASVVLLELGGWFLIMRRSPTDPNYPTFWNLPGGGLECGETPEEGAVRETFEETDIWVMPEDLTLIGVYDQPGYEVHLFHAYAPTCNVGLLDGEHDKAVWIRPNEVYKYKTLPLVRRPSMAVCDPATNQRLSAWWNKGDRQLYADRLNEAYADLFLWRKKECELACELAYWIVGREFGEEHPQAPKEGGSGCESICASQMPEYDCDPVPCPYGHPVTEASLDKDDAQSIHGDGVWSCDVDNLLEKIRLATQASQDACALLEVDISYEKSQRGNLTELRERKGITDDDLGIIYADREEAMVLVSPSGELAQQYEADAARNRTLYLIAAALGGVIVVGGISAYVMGRGE